MVPRAGRAVIRRGLLLTAFALVPARAALAQQPAERATLDSIRAAYEAQSDTTVLIRREREMIAVARVDRDNVMLHMELGYLAHRLGEITKSHGRFNDAASEFQWASDLRPQWPYAWYRLGLAELASGESQIIILENVRQLLGIDYLGNAAHHFVRAIQADPTFSSGIVDLATTAMRQRVAPHLVAVQAVLREVVAGPAGRVPDVQRMRGLIERRLEQPDSALDAFRAYLALGGDSGIGGVEVARTQALLGHTDSARTWYFRGVTRALSDSARVEVRRDLHWIATPAELAAFDASAPDSVAAFLHRFWERRDAADARRAGERLAEQFRRYHYVMTTFALASRHRNLDAAFAFGDSTQTDFDDRGVVYLRHGEPAQRVHFGAPGFDANESWLYNRNPPEGDLIVHFAAVNDVSDFRLMESLRPVCRSRSRYVEPLVNGSLDNPRFGRATILAPGVDAQCVESRATLSETYERMARVPSGASANMWAEERTASLRMVREAVTTDSYVHRYAASLRPVVSWFVMADADMRPELHLVFAVSATRLHPVAAAEGAMTYPLTLRLLVTDSATGLEVALLDTLRTFHSAQRLGSGAFLTEQLIAHVPAGRYRWAFVIEEQHASAGDAVTRQMVDVPSMARGFAASDVVMGREGSGLVWRHSGGDVPLNPLMRFPRDGDATLYYELYGLAQGSNVATRVRVIPAGGRSLLRRLFGGGGAADLAYSTVTDAARRSTVRQRIALKGLSPGRYTLQVELTDEASGTRIVRASPFEIGGGSAP